MQWWRLLRAILVKIVTRRIWLTNHIYGVMSYASNT